MPTPVSTDIQKLQQALASALGQPIIYSCQYQNDAAGARAFVKSMLALCRGHYTASLPSTLALVEQIEAEASTLPA
jgi:hypothetical protein